MMSINCYIILFYFFSTFHAAPAIPPLALMYFMLNLCNQTALLVFIYKKVCILTLYTSEVWFIKFIKRIYIDF